MRGTNSVDAVEAGPVMRNVGAQTVAHGIFDGFDGPAAPQEFEQELKKLTVLQLKAFLRAHGKPLTGLAPELVERARGVTAPWKGPMSEVLLPTDRQQDYMRDLENKLGRRMPALAWSSRAVASAAIAEAAEELAHGHRR